jgi:hypothetical protein
MGRATRFQPAPSPEESAGASLGASAGASLPESGGGMLRHTWGSLTTSFAPSPLPESNGPQVSHAMLKQMPHESVDALVVASAAAMNPARRNRMRALESLPTKSSLPLFGWESS